MNEKPIRIVAVAGSVRPGNFTGKALDLVAAEISQSDDASVDVVDLSEMHLPLPGQASSDDVSALQERFASATGVILATPEYHGSFSSVI